MNAGSASLLDALTGIPAKPGAQKTGGTVEGLFSAILGEMGITSPNPEPISLTPNPDGVTPDAAAILEAGQTSVHDESADGLAISPADGVATNDIADPTVETDAEIDPQTVTSGLVQPQITQEQAQAQSDTKNAPTLTTGVTTTPSTGTAPAVAAVANPQGQVIPGPVADRLNGIQTAAGQKAKPGTNEKTSPTQQTASAQTKTASKANSFGALMASQPTGQTDTANVATQAYADTITVDPVSGQPASIESASTSNTARGQIAQAASPVASLAVQIATRAVEGARRFEIRMDPPELGRIDVRLKIDDQGVASTRLVVERPETLELLQRDSRALERALGDAGLKTDEGGVRMSLKDGGGQQNAFSDRDQTGNSDKASSQGGKNSSDALGNADQDINLNPGMNLTDGMVNIVV